MTKLSHFDRQPGESVRDHVERILTEWLFLGSTDVEVAEWCDVSPQHVRKVRREMQRTETIRRLHVHAREVAAELGLEESPGVTIHRALEALREAHRAESHGSVAGPEIGNGAPRGGTRGDGASRAPTRRGDGRTGESRWPRAASNGDARAGST